MKPLAAKRHLTDLAALGGTPAFSEGRFVGQPNLGDTSVLFRRLDEALQRRYLTNQGPLLAEFETRLADYLGVRYCLTTTSGTQALELMVSALGLRGEILVPSFTFIASAHALTRAGLEPVFCDVDKTSHTLDVADVERRITPRTSAILGVHLWGHVCEVDALQAIADRHGLSLLFDACHAFGCALDGKRVGGFGEAEAFSFHATKLINTFEGGAIATNSMALARRVRRLRNFGFGEDDQIHEIGTNGKLNEASAAMGLTSLEAIDELIARNHSLFAAYRTGLRDVPGVRLVEPPAGTEATHHYAVIEIHAPTAGILRDDVMHLLTAENVHARRYFHPGCHRQAPYLTGVRLPNTELLSESVLALPCSGVMTTADVRQVCQLIRFIVQRARTGTLLEQVRQAAALRG